MILALWACLAPATDLELRLYRDPGRHTPCAAAAQHLGRRVELSFEPAGDHERALLTGEVARFLRLEVACGEARWASVVTPRATGRTRIDLRLEDTLVRYEPVTAGGTRRWVESAWYGLAGAWAVLVILLAGRLRR